MRNSLETIADEVSRSLAHAETFGGFALISTPLLHPSGAQVVVRIEAAGDGFIVTDHGAGYEEATQIDAIKIYPKVARQVAEYSGVVFDELAFFILKASRDQLTGAVATIANCVQEAVLITHQKAQEKRAQETAARLVDRLENIFTKRLVSRDVQLRGLSNHEWTFTSMVKAENQSVLFEAVNPHPSSIMPAFTKFSDLAQVQGGQPRRVSVIGHKEAYGDYYTLLSQVSSLMDQSANDNQYRSLVMTA